MDPNTESEQELKERQEFEKMLLAEEVEQYFLCLGLKDEFYYNVVSRGYDSIEKLMNIEKSVFNKIPYLSENNKNIVLNNLVHLENIMKIVKSN